MYLFRDEIVPEIETSDNKQHSYDTEEDLIVRYEQMVEDAPPLNNDYHTEDVPPTDSPTTTKKRKGRGPTKNHKVTEPMDLESNALGQPYGKGRRQYE